MPKGQGKQPRVSVSLPDDLKDIIEREATKRGITVSKYISDVLTHTHDENGLNPPISSGAADLNPLLMNMMETLTRDMQEMKKALYSLPAGSAAQRSIVQHNAAPLSPDDPGYVADLIDRFHFWMKQEHLNGKSFTLQYGVDASKLSAWKEGRAKLPQGRAQEFEDAIAGRLPKKG